MKEIKAYIRNEMVDIVLDALAGLPSSPAVTLLPVRGFGHPKGGGPPQVVERTKLEIVVLDEQVEAVVNSIREHARTGALGDGKIFVSDVDTALRIRTGDRDEQAL
ncbi:MAG: P-II family nitrogen regulator [Candidatus Binatia bacterium]